MWEGEMKRKLERDYAVPIISIQIGKREAEGQNKWRGIHLEKSESEIGKDSQNVVQKFTIQY